MAILNWRYLVHIDTRSIAALHGIGEWQLKMRVKNNSAAAFFGHIFVAVFGIHVVLAERTVEIVKLNAVE